MIRPNNRSHAAHVLAMAAAFGSTGFAADAHPQPDPEHNHFPSGGHPRGRAPKAAARHIRRRRAIAKKSRARNR